MSTVTWTSDGIGEEEPIMTTHAEGEEDTSKPWTEEPWYTTDAIGEEGPPEPVYDTATVQNPFGAF